tara:strand:+ start:35633 stop:35938 length:306 start_codon:yes stop_codon:yes gene_type:complete
VSEKYIVYCLDQPDSENLRAAAFNDHMQHLESVADQIYFAAALKDQAGNPTGSLMIVDAKSCADAKQFVQDDPFYLAGVWKELHAHHLGNAVGSWLQPATH